LQFIYYTDKTVAQCLSALNERMHVKGTSSRPAIDGWVEKSGSFSLAVTGTVKGRFRRTTSLHGKMERQGSYTTIRAHVNAGATRENLIVIYGALALVALALVATGNVLMALVVPLVGTALYVPLTGDNENSDFLLNELRKTLGAKATPPKAGASKAAAPKASRPAAPKGAARPAPATRPTMPAPKSAPPMPKPVEAPKFNLDS
jgi:hypothetical protein